MRVRETDRYIDEERSQFALDDGCCDEYCVEEEIGTELTLLEPSLDDQSPTSINTTTGTQLGEEELDDMLRLPVHLLADLDNVGKDGSLVSFSVHLRRCEEVLLLRASGGEGGVRGVEETVESSEDLRTRRRQRQRR
jgi:hypothetical protein